MKRIIASVMPEETRMVVLDEDRLCDIVLERPQDEHVVNHIYKGVVKNVLPGMEAAFVDIGRGQNAYLNLRMGKQARSLKLSEGKQLLVQVVKEEMLGKGARVSADISLAGRFMVLLPFSEGIRISKKIVNDETRQMLRDQAQTYLDKGCGFILRTAAIMATPEEIAADMAYLWQTWEQLQKRFAVAKGGTELYRDADFWFRLVRDYIKGDVTDIIVDDDTAYERLQELLSAASLTEQITLTRYSLKEPVFRKYKVDTQLDELLNVDVDLPSGGRLRIDHTEALTVIDVNSGSYVGQSRNAGETALAVNREAALEICRQLRLRDIGGIIIVDFIDMPKESQQQEIEAILVQEARRDRVKTVVCGMTSLGLVEMTRKRERQGLQSIMFDTCPSCGGTGYVLAAQTVYFQIRRRLRELYREGRLRSNVLLEVHSEVAAYFTPAVCRDMEQELMKTVEVESRGDMNREAYSLLAAE